jgi:hypothetical protein
MMRLLITVTLACSLAAAAACTSGSSSGPAARSGSPDTAPSGGHTRVPPVRAVLPQIEKFVERERGLTFKHPVPLSLLGKKKFLAKLHENDHDPKPLAVEKQTAIFASLGLISPNVDLVKAFRTATDAGTLGFYSYKAKRMYVLGHRATPGVRAVMAHELTHALTDQRFGLRRPEFKHDKQELSLAWTALIEGDAERTRVAYEKTLSSAEQAEARREEGGDSAPPKVPQIVLIAIGFPYAIGPTFVDAVVGRGGTNALDAAYRRPPTSSEQLVNPAAYFAHDEPVHVAVPDADGPVLEHGDLGLLGLLLTLERGLDRTTAQQAVSGWGGDQFVVWRAGPMSWCMRDTVVMDNADAAARLDSALSQWAATRNGHAHVERQGARTTFRSCSAG